MHMHRMFMKMYKKHGGPHTTGMSHGRHGFGHHKLRLMGLHKLHPLMAHKMHHGMHGKHHNMKHHRRTSSPSSSCSSDKEDEFLANKQNCNNNHNYCSLHSHKKPSPEMFLMKHKGHVSPFMEFKNVGPFHINHKMGHHKMYPGKFQKMLEMRHKMAHHKLGPMGHHKIHRSGNASIHGFRHHKMFKNSHRMKHHSI